MVFRLIKEAVNGSGGVGHSDAPVEARRAPSAFLSEIESAGVGLFWATNRAGLLSYISEKAAAALEKEPKDLLGLPITSLFSQTSIEEGGDTERSLRLTLRSQSKIEEQTVEICVGSGSQGEPAPRRWWTISAKPHFNAAGEFDGYRGAARDITRNFETQQKVARQSQYDELTGLANRHRFNRKLASTLHAFKPSGRSCALVMLDLDRFKHVNDTMGHPAGDELLKRAAERLQSIIEDKGEVARMGGDEFQILLPDVDDRGQLADLANRIIHVVSQPYTLGGRRALIGTSVGIAIAPYDGIDAEELNAAVDMALYAAKEGGKGTFRFYSAELKDAALQGAIIEEGLRDALTLGQISLNYQPLVNPRSDDVEAFEALMRWDHPEHGRISPAQFIPIAEQTDLVVRMGEWALKQACHDALDWPGDRKVAVNISAKQFMTPGFVKTVAEALAESQLDPSRLELEITESVFVGDDENVDKTFASLKKLGVRLAMDDFGTGYSSLGYLKRAPFDKIKIDQSFVRGCTLSGDTNPAIITAIVALAKALGMQTVAEGVEAMDELELVKERGADLVQGYIYSKPLAQDKVLEHLGGSGPLFIPDGPPRHRADRMTMLRKIGLIHEDHYYDVMLRNISKTGARIDGLGGVPVGEDVVLDLGAGQLVVSRVVHSHDITQGLEFETPLISDGYSGLVTRHRVSPYALAEAGMPLKALDRGSYPMHIMQDQTRRRPPRFLQHEL
ncbi:MAG: EAL domain-containing protein [Pseudomonadota bacterium]